MPEPKLIDNDAKRREDEDDDREVEERPEKATVEQADSGEVVVRPSRKERRSERGYKVRFEEATRAKDEELAKMRRELDEMRGMTVQMQRQVQSQAQPANGRDVHPLRPVMDRFWDHQVQIQKQMYSASTEEERKQLYEQWKDIEFERRKEEMKYYLAQSAQTQPRNAPDPHVAAEDVILRSEYPKVWANQQALQYAAAVFNQMKVRAQHTGSNESLLDLQRQALQTAAQTYGIDSTPPPSQGVQARFGAVSNQAGGTRAGAGEVRLSADQQRLARALYPQESDAVAFAKWANLWQKQQGQD